MKKYYFISALTAVSMLIGVTAYADTIWTEDFESYSAGTGIDGTGNIGDYPASVSKWTLDVSGATLSNADDYIKTVSGKMEARDTDGPVALTTESISINGYTSVNISVDITEDGDLETLDYADLEYRIDSGSWILIADWGNLGSDSHTLIGDRPDDNDWESETVTVSGLTGSTLEIRFTMSNNPGTEFIQIDNVTVSEGSSGPPAPEVTITNPVQDAVSVNNETTAYTVSGTSTNAVGTMTWSNALTDVAGTIAVTSDWSIASIALNEGVNEISVTGTNENGVSATDSVSITRAKSFSSEHLGCIAFVGIDTLGYSSNTYTDSISFVTLKALPAGTVIRFCDEEWNGAEFGTGEDDLVWSNNMETPAGSVVIIAKCSLYSAISNNIGTVVSGDLDLSKSGEGIIAYYGDAEREPTAFIAAINTANENLDGTGLSYGQTAVDISKTPESQYYDGARSGEVEWSDYLTLINNDANWSGTAGNTESWGDSTAFTRSKAGTVILLQ